MSGDAGEAQDPPRWRVEGYTEVRELGSGAQGRVVLARHAATGGHVAIKYLVRRAGDTDAIARLQDEAVMLAQVTDAHVVRVHEFVSGEHGAALVMEAVDGVSLKALLAERGPLAPEAALTVLKGSLLGLAAAHVAGVVHRDYKPANVVVRADGLSKLIDFGVAVLAGDSSRSGTPAYMAPEQWRAEPASPAGDVYAATCVFFECVVGRRPYLAENTAGMRDRHLNGPVPLGEVPEPLRPLLARGLAKEPGQRPPGAGAFVAELEAVAAAAYGPDWEQRGIRALAIGAVALAALFPLGVAVSGSAAGIGAAGAAGAAGAGTAGAGAGAAGAVGAGSAGGLLATVGAKVALAVGTATVVATGGGTAAYVASGENEPEKKRTVPVSAVTALNQSIALPGHPRLDVRNAQYARVSGIEDPALLRSVNTALRGPLDRRIAEFRKYVTGPHGEPDTPRCANLTSTVSVRYGGPALVSVRHVFQTRTCSVADEDLPLRETFTVDLRTGRAVRPVDVFRDLSATGIAALAAKVPQPPADQRFCVEGPLTRADLMPAAGGRGVTNVQLSFAAAGLELNYTPWVECTNGLVLTVPYAEVAGLMKPGMAAALPQAPPGPARS